MLRVVVPLFCWVFCAVGATAADRLVILTSFPSQVFEPFRQVFESQNPGLRVHILSQKTSAALSYVQGRFGHPVDLFWASAPDAFEVLKESGHLVPFPRHGSPRTRHIRGYPIDDPDHFYSGFALSGYGLMWNRQYLERRKLPPPARWDELKAFHYENHIGISSPSRSGTTHLIVEVILQSKGWQKGWETLLEIGGNLATVTARSFGVRNGVRNGQFGIGLVIDFFGLSSRSLGLPVEFTYPRETVFLPANIALVKGGENGDQAKAFIKFVTSEAGQRILFRPEVSRLPVRPGVYEDAPPEYPNPFASDVKTAGLVFDSQLSRKRYNLVNSLFDHLITRKLKGLKSAWHSVHLAEQFLKDHPAPRLLEAINSARARLTNIPVDEARMSDDRFRGHFSRRRPGYPVSPEQTALEDDWDSDAARRYLQAARLVEKARAAHKTLPASRQKE